MAFAQLTGRESLPPACGRCSPRCIMPAFDTRSRSTLADANENRDWRTTPTSLRCFGHARKLYRDDFGVQLAAYVFDSSTIEPAKSAIKLHTDGSTRPLFYSALQLGRRYDVGLLDELILEPGAFYILDRGYIDFARLYTFTQQAASLIRAKRNLDYTSPRYRNGAQRPDHRTARHKITPMSCAASLRRSRDGEAVAFPPTISPSRLDHPAVVQMLGVVLQVDQTTSAVLRHLRERGQDPDLDRYPLTCSWPFKKQLHRDRKSCKSSPFPCSRKSIFYNCLRESTPNTNQSIAVTS